MSDAEPGIRPVTLSSDEGARPHRRRRLLYATSTTVLCLIMVAALLDARLPIFGVDTDVVRAAGGGYELEVRYGAVSRSGLATPFDIVITSPGGFDEAEIDVAVTLAYLDLWDENGINPVPKDETVSDGDLIWTFTTPDSGDSLEISFDARIEPSRQNGADATVSVLDGSGAPVASVELDTRVWP